MGKTPSLLFISGVFRIAERGRMQLTQQSISQRALQ
jgi:hypothetical protein